jgi:glycosyltransferase involved in cell wall biosynthesis
MRDWDRRAAGRVDHFIGISQIVQQRIQAYYQRPADIIYPPAEVCRIPLSQEHGDYFLIISRLVPYKRIDLAVQAFNQLGLPLFVIGDGRDRRALQAMAKPNVRFLGHVSDKDAIRYRAGCRAFVFPGEEDFGIAPIEAQAAGRPVIAYAGGGALESVTEGITGLFFRDKTPESLVETLLRFDDRQFDPVAIRQSVLRFDRQEFERTFSEYVRRQYHPAE